MKRMNIFIRTVQYACMIFVATVGNLVAQDKDWRPVAPADLQMSSAVVTPNADAEAIFWEVRIDDSNPYELVMRHYVRVKIFTEKGREDFSRHDITYANRKKIRDIEARVTNPDGSVSTLKKDDVFDREIVRASGLKVKAKTFALPGIQVGSIVEYKYKEVTDGGSANMALIFQRDLPIRSISYWVKPFDGDLNMRTHPFNTRTKFEKEKDGFHRATMTNLPAVPDEPNMPPDDEVRSWMYIYYTADTSKNPQEYWKSIGSRLFQGSKDNLKPNDDIKRATDAVIAGATSDREKLERIFDYVKKEIRNLNFSENVTDDERKKAREMKNASAVFKAKYGFSSDVEMVFGAMARAAGFDARIAITGNRDEIQFDGNVMHYPLVLGSTCIAVNVGGNWEFFSPGSYFSTFGILAWFEEGQPALIADDKAMLFKDIPMAPATISREARSGKFTLDENGTLSGKGKIIFTGHPSTSRKNTMRMMSASERSEYVKSIVRGHLALGAEIDEISITGDRDPKAPLVLEFKINAPGYASRTGRRLFLQPNIFERGSKPRFTAETRSTDIFFRYPTSVEDDFSISLPKGFKLESADRPEDTRDTGGIGESKIRIAVNADQSEIMYTRSFSWGNGGHTRFAPNAYPAIKQLFDEFHKAEVHQLTLRQE